jgi:ribosomal protein L22
MTEENKKQNNENNAEAKVDAVKTEKKEKTETKKVENLKRDSVSVKGFGLGISPKESFSFCNMIRDRTVDTAIRMTEEVLLYKRVVKMNNREVPHQHGRGVMAGRFPMNTAKEFLKMLKSLKANAIHHEIELEKAVISCKADFASRPYKRGGARMKRTNVIMSLAKKKEVKQEKKK